LPDHERTTHGCVAVPFLPETENATPDVPCWPVSINSRTAGRFANPFVKVFHGPVVPDTVGFAPVHASFPFTGSMYRIGLVVGSGRTAGRRVPNAT
jgi:hypothetical protein